MIRSEILLIVCYTWYVPTFNLDVCAIYEDVLSNDDRSDTHVISSGT